MRDYTSLPDVMEYSDIEALADELLGLAETDNTLNKADVADALIQLDERQTYNYAPFGERIASRIERWVEQAWSDEDAELDSALTSILVNIRTAEGHQLLERAKQSNNPAVRVLAENALVDLNKPQLFN